MLDFMGKQFIWIIIGTKTPYFLIILNFKESNRAKPMFVLSFQFWIKLSFPLKEIYMIWGFKPQYQVSTYIFITFFSSHQFVLITPHYLWEGEAAGS